MSTVQFDEALANDLPHTYKCFIWHFIKKQKWKFLAITVASFSLALSNNLIPYLYKLLIDQMVQFTGDKTHAVQALMPTFIIWLIAWACTDGLYRLMGWLFVYTYPTLDADIRLTMFNYMTRHSYDYFANHFAGNVSNKISDMVSSTHKILGSLQSLIIPGILSVITAICIFLSINLYFALLVVIWISIHTAICIFIAKKCCHYSNIHAQARSQLTGKIVDIFTNIINVKLFSRRLYEFQRIQAEQAGEQLKNKRASMMVEWMRLAQTISGIIFPGGLMTFYTIYAWQQNLLSIGDVILILTITMNIVHLTWMVGSELPHLFRELGVCQQALTIMQAPHDICEQSDAQELIVKQGHIEFDNVSFYYAKENKVFKNINVTIEPGTKVGIVGFSGSGKSTFVNIIMRFFDIAAGEIRIDGTNIADVKLDSLRRNISMIPQDPTLFHRTLEDNIRYGKLNASFDEIVMAAKQAYCHDFIQALPNGYQTLVGERGIKLSGGQRQRIAIARAILDNAPILILDEATSALDTFTEKHIQKALTFLMQERTTIVIAHRLSTLADMDRILVFDNGQIIEDGSHKQLLKAKGHYANMWSLQAGGFLPEAETE